MSTVQTNADKKEVKPVESLRLIRYKHFRNCQKGRLLVLDLDKTLCDFGYNGLTSQNPTIPRPYLHDFLKTVQDDYDLAVWSATSLKAIMIKMERLEILHNENFRINFVIDKTYMVPTKLKCSDLALSAKPLSVIWKKYPKYNETNTIIIDDSLRNFYFNPKNGLLINRYEQFMYNLDNDLVHIGAYLIKLAKNCKNFTMVNHSDYENYLPAAENSKSNGKNKKLRLSVNYLTDS